jgi:FtsZ-binding cell division protein ZapB
MSSEAEALGLLEDRIRKAVELVTTLRAERDSAISETAKLRAQVESMEQERVQVRSRIEKLLGQMDQL